MQQNQKIILHTQIRVRINIYDWIGMHTCTSSDMEWLAIFSSSKTLHQYFRVLMDGARTGPTLWRKGKLVGTRFQAPLVGM